MRQLNSTNIKPFLRLNCKMLQKTIKYHKNIFKKTNNDIYFATEKRQYNAICTVLPLIFILIIF